MKTRSLYLIGLTSEEDGKEEVFFGRFEESYVVAESPQKAVAKLLDVLLQQSKISGDEAILCTPQLMAMEVLAPNAAGTPLIIDEENI